MISSVCVAMSYRSLVYFATLLTLCVCQSVRLDPSRAVPLHYNIETTLTINSQKFSSNGSIVIHLLEDANEIQFFAGALKSQWFDSVLEDEDGVIFTPKELHIELDEGYTSLIFDKEFKSGFNYTLHFYNVEGKYGRGLVEVWLPTRK